MYPHRIRLRGPWECEPLARAGGDNAPLPPPLRMTIPCSWKEGGLVSFAGRVRFRRRFGYPGRLDAHERVWLTFAGVEGPAEVRLNDTPLGKGGADRLPFAFEVTALLRERNELVVDVESASEHGGICGEVALEVRCSAFLRGVRVEVGGGRSPRPGRGRGHGGGVAGVVRRPRPFDGRLRADERFAVWPPVSPRRRWRPRRSRERAGCGRRANSNC